MTGWTVELNRAAWKELRQLPDGPRQAALDLLEDLREVGPALVPAIELTSNLTTGELASTTSVTAWFTNFGEPGGTSW